MYKKHDKAAVLKIGIDLFRSQGFSHLGVDEICKSTGMTKGAFYNAFKSKEQFLIESLSSYGQFMTSYIDHNLKNSKEKAINRLSDLYEKLLLNQQKINYSGCMVNNMMSELGGMNKNVAMAAIHEFEQFVEVVEPYVIEAQTSGDLNSDINAKTITELLHTTFYGVLTRSKSLQDYTKGRQSMKLLIQSLSTNK